MVAHPSSQCLVLDALEAGQSTNRDGWLFKQPWWLPPKKTWGKHQGLCPLQGWTLSRKDFRKDWPFSADGQFCCSPHSDRAPMCMYVLLKYPWSPGPVHRKCKQRTWGYTERASQEGLVMPKPALDFTGDCYMSYDRRNLLGSYRPDEGFHWGVLESSCHYRQSFLAELVITRMQMATKDKA